MKPARAFWSCFLGPTILGLGYGGAIGPSPIARAGQPAQPGLMNPDCASCHACDMPTAGNRCLRRCARNLDAAQEAMGSPHGPTIVLLDELTKHYLPVPFDHRGHALMADMTGGCAVCHHHTPEGAEHPACKTCHSIVGNGGDIRRPGLKGAYHRQCLSCHREWSDENSCSICHAPRTAGSANSHAPTPDDLIGRMHPPIPEPDEELYRTEREGHAASSVLFRHKGHIEQYDLKCSDCHREDNCSRCHAAGKEHVQRVRTLDEHHQPCFTCHKDDTCERCHFGDRDSPPPPFSHATTGWPLKRHHEAASCRDCHTAPPYVKRATDCRSCHQPGFPTDFDHSRTGLILDETHKALDCGSCHPDGNPGVPPTCNDCHELDEGISYPAKQPGRRIEGAGLKVPSLSP